MLASSSITIIGSTTIYDDDESECIFSLQNISISITITIGITLLVLILLLVNYY